MPMMEKPLGCRKWIPLFTLLTTILSTSFSPWTCQPQPDYWFAEKITIAPLDLPEPLSITHTPKNAVRGHIQIQNESNHPLYVLPNNTSQIILVTETPSISSEGLSGEVAPKQVLLFEQVPALAAHIIRRDEPLQLDVFTLPTVVSYIEDRNVSGFHRPGFVILPTTQRGEFYLVYEQEFITVTFAISYALNSNFNPEDCGGALDISSHHSIAPSKGQESTLASAIALTAMLCITALATLWLWRHVLQ
jgi:hypothetical protein